MGSKDNVRVVQLTTVHSRKDVRIAVKQCSSLARVFEGEVELVVADGNGDEPGELFNVVDLGFISSSRFWRPFRGFVRATAYLMRRRPSVLHFHDPELIPVGFVAKILGIRVVYDVHENVRAQLRARRSLGAVSMFVLTSGVAVAEWIAARVFDRIVCATPGIAMQFPAHKTTLVQNFPIVGELSGANAVPQAQRPRRFAYIGGISEQRGAREMLAAVDAFPPDADVGVDLAGRFSPESLLQELEASPGAARSRFLGWLDRGEVAQLLAGVRAGLVALHATPNHINSQPIKLFEYMSAGLPVIASDFPLWRELIEDTGAGLLVDPMDPGAICTAMQKILDDPAGAEAMGRKGRSAIESRYNWAVESRELIGLYTRMLGEPATAPHRLQ